MRIASIAILTVALCVGAGRRLGAQRIDPDPASGVQSRTLSLPVAGMVPDSATAVRLARVLLTAFFDKRRVAMYEPYQVTLNGDTWTVTRAACPPKHICLGGVEIELAKRDGRVLRIEGWK
jgi:hypothetical protein